ncbi:hypothetical protein VY88_23330 [Azospirillum thiophilum]|uniref:Uncharacterized protein n=1 Tax=Azospirillum thiophilum TaxID=528244 RepID=A0AAC8ZVE0_9PROT|nr:hypothetical protein [Azospirillum thiophilum]ALG73720.1 hypothetical protein AL072_22505 [Azospirillum thiophilum]KJR63108.1 hypothetical protein VY88_23330 [Azospirillum thiophilum]
MPSIADLAANPESFLKNNLLLVQYQSYQPNYRVGGVKGFSLSDDGMTCTRKGTGVISQFSTKNAAVWSVRYDQGNLPGSWNAYWLPYDQDFKHLVVLEDEADVMFTPTMDGCSFGFSDHGGGTYSASHGNLQTAQGRIDEAGLRQGMRLHGTTLHKSQYMNVPGTDAVKVTLVGVRNGKKWRFFYQQYVDNMGAFTLLKVAQVKR